MSVAVIGSGVAGASAAHVLHQLQYLRESGHSTSMRRWVATAAILDEDGVKHEVRYDRPWTLLRMPQLTWGDRVRLGRTVAALALRRGKPAPFDIDGLAAVDDGTTLAQWARATFGERVYEYVVRPLMGPLTGADPRRISSAFTKALLGFPTRTRLTVPDGGLGRIASWMLDGLDVRLSTPVASIVPEGAGVTIETSEGSIAADGVVVATDVTHARELLDGVVDPGVVKALDGVEIVRAHHVLFGYRRGPWPGATHDLVVHAGAGQHPNYGVLLDSRRNQGWAPAGGQTVSVWFDHEQSGDVDEAASSPWRATPLTPRSARPSRTSTRSSATTSPSSHRSPAMTRRCAPPETRCRSASGLPATS